MNETIILTVKTKC